MDAEAYADMLPWLVFLAIARRSGLTVGWAAGCATACSAGLAAWSYWRGRRAPLPIVGLGFFVPCYVAALMFPSWNSAIGLSRSMAVLVVSLAAFTSLRFTPLTESYTAPLVAPSVRENPGFHRVNVEMTAAWGVGSLLAAATSASSALVRSTFGFTFMDWVIPIVFAVGTLLWATRRWEFFWLSLDEGGADTAAAGHPAAHPAFEPWGGTEDAVIHELPIRSAASAVSRENGGRASQRRL